jgi:hypothetical protein
MATAPKPVEPFLSEHLAQSALSIALDHTQFVRLRGDVAVGELKTTEFCRRPIEPQHARHIHDANPLPSRGKRYPDPIAVLGAPADHAEAMTGKKAVIEQRIRTWSIVDHGTVGQATNVTQLLERVRWRHRERAIGDPLSKTGVVHA